MNICALPLTNNPPTPHRIAKLESGASNNYFRLQDEECLEGVHEADGPTAITPTLETLKATKEGKLPFSNTSITSKALKTHVFPKLGSASLISVPQLCDDGCKVVFDKKHVCITKNKEIIITGRRNNIDGLWDILIPVNSDTTNNIIGHI